MALSLLQAFHVNVNCSDLDRSRAFYERHCALSSTSHTNPLPQEGRGFGLPGQVQWDAHILHDARGMAGATAVDLLEWKAPAPVGRPPATPFELGFSRLCFACPDLGAKHAELEADGVRCLSGPAEVPLAGDARVRFLCALDPDGTLVEFLEIRDAEFPRLLHVNVNASDLARSSDWYQRVLGLERAGGAAPGPCDATGFGRGGTCEFRADFLAVPGQAGTFVVDLLEWRDPKPTGAPSAEANRLGMFRMAFLVEDAHASCAELDRLGVDHSGPCWLDMGPEVPMDGLNAVFFRDPDGTCLELIEVPR